MKNFLILLKKLLTSIVKIHNIPKRMENEPKMNMVSTTYKNLTGTVYRLFSTLVADTMLVPVSIISIIATIIRIIGIIILSLIIGILRSGRIILR